MPRKAVDNRVLTGLREATVIEALARLSDHWKVDASYRPLKSARSIRVHLTAGGREYELVCTGAKWWDTRAHRGGGGAIDLAMHLYQCSFKRALELLEGER